MTFEDKITEVLLDVGSENCYLVDGVARIKALTAEREQVMRDALEKVEKRTKEYPYPEIRELYYIAKKALSDAGGNKPPQPAETLDLLDPKQNRAYIMEIEEAHKKAKNSTLRFTSKVEPPQPVEPAISEGAREGISEGLQAFKEGRMRPWADIKDELGIEPSPLEEKIISLICSMDCQAKAQGADCPCEQMKQIAKDIMQAVQQEWARIVEGMPTRVLMHFDDGAQEAAKIIGADKMRELIEAYLKSKRGIE